MCYRNAYAKNQNGDIKWEIGNLYRKMEQWTLALQSYKSSLKFFPGEKGSEALKNAREFAKQIYDITRSINDEESVEKMKADALDMLLGTIQRHQSFVQNEDINYAGDLLIELERYTECLEFLETHCGFGAFCSPTETRYDLTCKAALCLISLGEDERAQDCLKIIKKKSPNFDQVSNSHYDDYRF